MQMPSKSLRRPPAQGPTIFPGHTLHQSSIFSASLAFGKHDAHCVPLQATFPGPGIFNVSFLAACVRITHGAASFYMLL